MSCMLACVWMGMYFVLFLLVGWFLFCFLFVCVCFSHSVFVVAGHLDILTFNCCLF